MKKNFLLRALSGIGSVYNPKKEQIERNLYPIIEKILREEHGKKELYY